MLYAAGIERCTMAFSFGKEKQQSLSRRLFLNLQISATEKTMVFNGL
jgi:hypothetical protein